MIICKANKDQRKWFWKDEVKPSILKKSMTVKEIETEIEKLGDADLIIDYTKMTHSADIVRLAESLKITDELSKYFDFCDIIIGSGRRNDFSLGERGEAIELLSSKVAEKGNAEQIIKFARYPDSDRDLLTDAIIKTKDINAIYEFALSCRSYDVSGLFTDKMATATVEYGSVEDMFRFAQLGYGRNSKSILANGIAQKGTLDQVIDYGKNYTMTENAVVKILSSNSTKHINDLYSLGYYRDFIIENANALITDNDAKVKLVQYVLTVDSDKYGTQFYGHSAPFMFEVMKPLCEMTNSTILTSALVATQNFDAFIKIFKEYSNEKFNNSSFSRYGSETESEKYTQFKSYFKYLDFNVIANAIAEKGDDQLAFNLLFDNNINANLSGETINKLIKNLDLQKGLSGFKFKIDGLKPWLEVNREDTIWCKKQVDEKLMLCFRSLVNKEGVDLKLISEVVADTKNFEFIYLFTSNSKNIDVNVFDKVYYELLQETNSSKDM